MGLPWVRLDCTFPRNPKVLELLAEKDGYRAAFVYLCSLAYSGEQGSDGFIPSFALSHVHGRPRDAELLTACRLWHAARGGGGWTINDWAEFQQSDAETQARARAASRAGRKANCKRWHEQPCDCWVSEPDSLDGSDP